MTTTAALAEAHGLPCRHDNDDSTEADVRPEDMLTTRQVAELVGITEKGIRKHRERGTIPEPDDVVLGHPLWKKTTINRWIATRPRRGYNESTHANRRKPAEP